MGLDSYIGIQLYILPNLGQTYKISIYQLYLINIIQNLATRFGDKSISSQLLKLFNSRSIPSDL